MPPPPFTPGPHVPRNQLTLGYIQSLIARCGHTDKSSEHAQQSECAWVDQDGSLYQGSLASARDQLILQYLIQQNS